jgi:hypothetical protein
MTLKRLAGAAPFILLILLGSTPLRAGSPVLTPEIREAMDRISPDSIWAHVSVLGSDPMEGRGTGTGGGKAAAAYLGRQMERMGLRPMGDRGSYFQSLPLHGSKPLPGCRFEISDGDTTIDLRLGEDYLLYTAGAGTLIPTPVPLVFAGYGIVAPEFDYNDYQTLDVNGSIVVFLSGEPFSRDSTYFEGDLPTIHSLPEIKQRLAIARGARGSIMIPLPRKYPDRNWSSWVGMFAFEHVTFPFDLPRNLSVVFNQDRADLLFRNAPYTLREVFRMDSTHAIRSFDLDVKASFFGRFQERDFVTANVVGAIDGSDPLLRDSYVLVSAHYDHLGIGPAVNGDSIYNGVVDNALGCSATLEIARVVAGMPEKPSRSLLFLFVTGEEKGLLGSSFYCMHPVVPLSQTVANVNIDGLAIIDVFEDIVGVGAELSTLGDHLEDVAEELELLTTSVPAVFLSSDHFSQSDQLAFGQAGIPSILVMEGFRYRNIESSQGLRRFVSWGEERYHSPFDDLSQPVNHQAMLQHCEVLFAFVSSLANTFTPPQWVSGPAYMNARLKSLFEER